ncbi:MAG: GNAT family N-acetyltransferase [Hyphomicrobium sp.]|nr:GNAT family N-acetyltransferase [Hyphomicrobium sp.]
MSLHRSLPVERYETETFAPADSGLALRALPLGEPVRLGPILSAIPPWSTLGYSAEQLSDYLGRIEKTAPRYGLLAGNEVVGVACVRFNWLTGPYLQYLAVLPDFQRRGLGSLFLKWLDAEARASGERNVWVCASAFNTDAQAFYAKHGYEPVAELADLLKDGFGEILMRRKL